MASTRTSCQDIFLIGNVDAQIYGNKLPSRLQILKVLFFNLRELKLTLRESSTLTINEAMIFWAKARLPTQRLDRCVTKLENLYEDWRKIQKNRGQSFNEQRESDFTSQFNNLFDIAHGNVLEMIDERGKDFLINQRKDGRIGFIGDIETIYDTEEKTKLQREEIGARRLKRSIAEKELLNRFVELETSSESVSLQSLSQRSVGTYSNISIEDVDDSSSIEVEDDAGPSIPKKPRGMISFIDEKLVAALDKCKLSDRDSVHLIAATAQSLGHDLDSLIINRTSIQRCRQKLRETKAKNIKTLFKNIDVNSVVLHWDGKMLPNLLKREVSDRLPIVITNGDIDQLLGIPELVNGTGLAQAKAIYEVLEDWGLCDAVKALCCDTTAANLGGVKGAAVLLEQMLERDILLLPCRHHIFEIILRSVFEEKMPGTSGPSVPIFKRFQEAWPQLDKSKYKSGIESENVQNVLIDNVESINSVVEDTLISMQPRDDYKELLELTQIFLGIIPSRGVRFRFPGAYHHARWMSKAIYCIKIYLFREVFKLTKKEEKALWDVCIFIVIIYVKAWFTAPLAPQAPNHDLQFLKKLHNYKSVDADVSRVTLLKLKNHLWYLSPESAAIAFFDEKLSSDVKRKMLFEINSSEETSYENSSKRLQIDPKNIEHLLDKEMDYFVTSQSLNFFDRFNINRGFLTMDPSLWFQDKNFAEGLKIVKNLKVVNDVAERAVCLIESYNNILTKNETQKQYVLQIVSEYRKKFPDAKKETVMRNY